MDYVANSEPIIRLAYWAGVGAFLISLLLVLEISRLRLLSANRERRKQKFIEVWRNLLNESLLAQQGESLSSLFRRLPAIASRDTVFFLSYWNRLQASVRGDARTRLNLVLQETGMDEAARRLLLKGNDAEKLLALVTLSYCGTGTDRNLLQPFLRGDQPLACLHAARALLHIDPEMPAELLRIIARRKDLSLAAIAGLLQEAGANATSGALAELLREALGQDASPGYMARLISLAATAHPEMVREPLCMILDSTGNPDVMANCIRVMHHPEVLERIRRFASHPEWQVRVQAASALGDIGEEADVEILKSLLADPQWWVRFRAAHALAQLPFLLPSELEAIRMGVKDRFAADMLGQVMSERA